MKHWPRHRLTELCINEHDIRCGPFGTQLVRSEYQSEGVPLWSITHVNRHFTTTTNEFLTPKKAKELDAYSLLPGDIVMTRKATVGNCTVYPKALPNGIMHSDLLRIRVNPAVCLPQFLSATLASSTEVKQQVQSVAAGAVTRGINVSMLKTISVSIPPLAEQERIVKLLDQGDELRKLRAQADRRTAALIPALFHEMFGANGRKTFEHVKLNEVAEVVSGIAKGRKFNGRQPVVVPYLRVANVQAGHLNLSEIKTIQALPEEVTELALRKGDVLLTEGGDFDKLGRGAMLEQDLPNCIHQNHVFRVRVEQAKLHPIFFAEFLITNEARRYFLSCAKKTTNLASINMTQLRGLPMPLPPLALQKEFAARVTEFRAMQAEQSASRLRLENLVQSLLHRAFNGQL